MKPMRTICTHLLAWILVAAGAAGADVLPRPPALEPQVRFWTRVYSEVGTGGGFIHDARHMGVVYEVLQVPDGLSRRSRERHINRAKKKYVDALKILGAGRRSNLTDTQARVLALWPQGVSSTTLKAAAREVRFQRGQANRFREGVIRSGLYEPTIRDIFADHGVPQEIAALPHVESSFNPRAYSSAGAAGLWQFTRSTGRIYMRVDYVVDERMDPFRATEAAADLLSDNYKELKTWPLAITAYNHGQAGMSRAVRATGTRDIAKIVETYNGRAFKFASRNFYTELLAAIDVERDAEKHFGVLERHDPSTFDMVEVDHFYKIASLERALGLDASVLRGHNLSLQPAVWRGQKYVPRGFPLRIPHDPSGAPPATALAAIPNGERFVAQKRDTVHVVRRGETLSQIAGRYHVSTRDLVALNSLRSAHRIRIGQALRLPGVDEASVAMASRATPDADGTYRVRRGDTLSVIARRLKTSEEALIAANGLPNKNRLYAGQRLRIPGAATSVAAAPKPSPVPDAPADVEVASVEVAGKERISVTLPKKTAPTAQVAALDAKPASTEPQPAVQPAVQPAAQPAVQPTTEPATQVAAESAEQPANTAIPREIDVATAGPSPARSAAVVVSSPAVADPLARLDLAVGSDDHIVVAADETLGHYADWLQISTSQLRRRNGLRPRAALVIGQRVRLDFSRVSRADFDSRRRAHHIEVRNAFFVRYRVAGTQTHTLRRGDTLWSLSRRHRAVPIWLLREYNPNVDLTALQPGAEIRIPRLERRPS
jgi:membrane-bound lytic murein transglycosylase D